VAIGVQHVPAENYTLVQIIYLLDFKGSCFCEIAEPLTSCLKITRYRKRLCHLLRRDLTLHLCTRVVATDDPSNYPMAGIPRRLSLHSLAYTLNKMIVAPTSGCLLFREIY